MFNITLPVADTIFTLANAILVLGAVLALIGTAGVFWSGGIREKFADERIAANEAATARANAEAARANAEAAKANAEAAIARLDQERLKSEMAWRTVSAQQATLIATALRGAKLDIWVTFVRADPESTNFREDINNALVAAGVKTQFYSGYTRALGLTLMGGSPDERKLVLAAFQSAHLPLIASDEQTFMQKGMEILVGTKPPPSFQR